MDRQVDTGTQTDPVVVLSLAQAAVLGLISQNEIFGATIAPNGFYTGEAKECPLPPADGTGYEYADQLIGANGDYLAEPLEGGCQPQACTGAQQQQGPSEKDNGTRMQGEPVQQGSQGPPADRTSEAEVKGEGTEVSLSPCFHILNSLVPREGVQLVDPGTYRIAPKEEQQPSNCCPDCEREVKRQQTSVQITAPPREEATEVGPQSAVGQEEQPVADRGEGAGDISMKSGQEGSSPQVSGYFESSELSYEANEAGAPEDFDEGSQSLMWPEAADSEGQPGRRVQIDRLDINVQIDESYCVDVGEGLRRWKCRMCEKSYTSKYNLVTHILGHNGIKPHECPHCGKLFKQPSHLQTHLLTHQGTRPHKCTVCKKAFTQTSHLKRHMLQHTDVKPYSCRFCGRGFAYPSELRAHETKHESGSCHVCAQCGMEFPTQAHLKRHQASHQGPVTYQCSECEKAFAYRSQLQNHLMKHQNVRPFACAECGMEFVQIHHLKQHALTHKVLKQSFDHKGMKEFKCDVCSREFTLSANLKRHMLIHASVRPYQCHICFKTFVQKQTLKTHMIVHLPVKPFKCKVCGKSFNRMYNLLGHMHLHAGSKPFKCPYCSSKFNLKGNLSRHMKVKHGINEASPEGQDALPDAEEGSHEEYEEENMDFTETENITSNNAPDIAKLSEEAMQEMDYYTFGKGSEHYNTV
uniref:Zinc finger protein 710 n=2 Tax=Scleropages formosus TaxID=113540 RepID=A0A8C9RWV8_SCLFO